MADCDGDEMFLASKYEGPVLPWDRFRRWVTCFCVVTFDLELGQALEVSTTSVHASRSAQSWALNAEYLSMCLWWIRYGLSCFNVMILIYSVTARLPRSYRTDGPWGEGHYTDFELMTVMISLQLSRRIRFIRHFIRLLYERSSIVLCLVAIIWQNARIKSHFVHQIKTLQETNEKRSW